MKKGLFLFCVSAAAFIALPIESQANPTSLSVYEIVNDNGGAGAEKGIDITGSTDADSTDWSDVLYNDGVGIYNTMSLSGAVFGRQKGLDASSPSHHLNISTVSSSIDTGQSLMPQPIPEPSTMILLGSGVVGLAGLMLRKRRK